MSASNYRRRAGLLMPLFSCTSTASWGIGDIGDIEPLTAWLAGAGQRILQLLPLNEMAPGQQSPYSAISAMAIDPIFISVPQVAEFIALGGEAALSASDRETLTAVRLARRIEHRDVRALKRRALRAAFERFLEREWKSGGERGRAFQSYVSEQAWWLEDYALFRALHARERERPWTEWPDALQRRDPPAIDRARRELVDEVLFQQYLQWLAGSQWQQARRNTHGVALFGDLPFMVDTDSADVWVRQHQFRLDMSVGAPPDAFSATGQDWGMPVYHWSALAAEDYLWLRERARRSADLFDGYRIDHLVGFYRTYGRLKGGGEGFFTPAGRAGAAGARRNGARSVSRRRRGNHRRGSRHRPRFRARVARAPEYSGFPRLSMGTQVARRRAAVPRPVRLPASIGRGVGDARHRTGLGLVGRGLGIGAQAGG